MVAFVFPATLQGAWGELCITDRKLRTGEDYQLTQVYSIYVYLSGATI